MVLLEIIIKLKFMLFVSKLTWWTCFDDFMEKKRKNSELTREQNFKVQHEDTTETVLVF